MHSWKPIPRQQPEGPPLWGKLSDLSLSFHLVHLYERYVSQYLQKENFTFRRISGTLLRRTLGLYLVWSGSLPVSPGIGLGFSLQGWGTDEQDREYYLWKEHFEMLPSQTSVSFEEEAEFKGGGLACIPGRGNRGSQDAPEWWTIRRWCNLLRCWRLRFWSFLSFLAWLLSKVLGKVNIGLLEMKLSPFGSQSREEQCRFHPGCGAVADEFSSFNLTMVVMCVLWTRMLSTESLGYWIWRIELLLLILFVIFINHLTKHRQKRGGPDLLLVLVCLLLGANVVCLFFVFLSLSFYNDTQDRCYGKILHKNHIEMSLIHSLHIWIQYIKWYKRQVISTLPCLALSQFDTAVLFLCIILALLSMRWPNMIVLSWAFLNFILNGNFFIPQTIRESKHRSYFDLCSFVDKTGTSVLFCFESLCPPTHQTILHFLFLFFDPAIVLPNFYLPTFAPPLLPAVTALTQASAFIKLRSFSSPFFLSFPPKCSPVSYSLIHSFHLFFFFFFFCHFTSTWTHTKQQQ